MFAACPITEQRRGLGPGVPFQTRKSGTRDDRLLLQVCTKFELQCVLLRVGVPCPKGGGCGDARSLLVQASNFWFLLPSVFSGGAVGAPDLLSMPDGISQVCVCVTILQSFHRLILWSSPSASSLHC